MASDTIWELAPHTAAKHAILRKYLGGWLPKMASWQNRLLFIDGLAGPGRYSGGESGSPLIALEVAAGHKHDLSGCELVFLFVEEDAERFRHLEQTIAEMDNPAHIKIESVRGAFTDVMAEMVRQLDEKTLAPALIMVDPFGVKGANYETLKVLAAYPRTELLISFMYESVARWINAPQFEAHLDAFFGCGEWRAASGMSAREKREYLLDLYIKQIKAAGLRYVHSFEMRDDGNRTEYYLVFATHHPEGLNVIKQAMWALDPTGRFQFSDFTNPNQTTLFTIEPDYAQLRSLVIARFAGCEVGIEAVEQFVIEETAFLTSHLRKPILIPLEDGGELEVSGRTKRHTYPKGCRLTFR